MQPMKIATPDLCDEFPDLVRIVEPLFNNYGGKKSFGGLVTTVQCFEDNSRVKEAASEPGEGRVLVVDGGGSLRRALLGDMIAEAAMNNGWQGFIIYGAIRDVDDIAELDIGVKALDSIPLKSDRRGLGDRDVAVSFAGATFSQGEYVYADNTGILVSEKVLI